MTPIDYESHCCLSTPDIRSVLPEDLKKALLDEHTARFKKLASNGIDDYEKDEVLGKLLSNDRIRNLRVSIHLAYWIELCITEIDSM